MEQACKALLTKFATPARSPAPGDAAIREVVLAQFLEQLDVKPIRRSSAVEISFDSQDPNLAARVVNALADTYIQRNMESGGMPRKRPPSGCLRSCSDLKASSKNRRTTCKPMPLRNGLLFLETSQGNTESIEDQSLREMQEELTKAQADRYETESLYRLMQAGDFGSLPGVFDNKLMQDLSVRLADLQSQRAELEATFTADYPKMKQAQSQIVEIQAALDRERQRAAQKISNDYFAAVRREDLVQQAFARETKAGQPDR